MSNEEKDAKVTLNVGEEEADEIYKEGRAASYRQLIAALIAHFGAVLMAEVWSYSATALPSMREGDHAMELNSVEEAWMGSITFLGGVIGSFLSGFITQKFGVKASLIIVTVPILLGWLLIAFAVNFPMVLVGRLMTGAFVAAIGVSTTLIAEISNPSRRGRLNFLFDMSFCVGVLLIYIFGVFLNWRLQAGICAVQCVLFLILLTQVYESPRVLLDKNKEKQAKCCLQHYRDKDDVNTELGNIKRQIRLDEEDANENCSGRRFSFLSFLTDKAVLKPIYIALALQFFLQLCGVVPIVCYAVDVFREAGSTHENLSTCIFGLVNLLATMAGYFCIDKLGRRALLMISESVLTLTLFGLGLFLYFKEKGALSSQQHDYYSWVPLAFLIVYIIAYSFGVGPIPWVVMGEVVNPKAKGFSSGVIIFGSRIFGFLIMFYFNDLMDHVGQHGVYWLFSGICLAGLLFACFLLPETKEKELQIIQDEIRDKWVHFSCFKSQSN